MTLGKPYPFPQYSLEFGSYYLRKEGSDAILNMCDQVAFAYMSDGTIFRHGPPKSVRQLAKDYKLEFLKLPRGFPVDVINHCLQFRSVSSLLERIEAGEFDGIGEPYDIPD